MDENAPPAASLVQLEVLAKYILSGVPWPWMILSSKARQSLQACHALEIQEGQEPCSDGAGLTFLGQLVQPVPATAGRAQRERHRAD